MVKPDQIEIPQNPSETDIIAHSIRLLRKIRGFTEGKSIWDPPYTPIERRQFLLDAEQVGSVCANSLITPVNTTGVEERDTWFSTMVGLCPKYSSKREVTWMGYSLDNTVRRMEVKLGALQYWAPRIIDPKTQKTFINFSQT